MKMAGQPRYKTEVFIPIKKDDQTFEQRQKSLWDSAGHSDTHTGILSDVHSRLDLRRREWEDEIDRMRKDFFRLKPEDKKRDSSEHVSTSMRTDEFITDDPRKQGQKRFQVGFDVREFRPEEVSVRTQGNKLIVNARHEEQGQGHSVSREFSRQVDIPPNVDPNALSCVYTQDGVLQIEAPVPAPTLSTIQNRPTYAARQQQASPTYQVLPQQPSGALMETGGPLKAKMVVDVGRDYRPEEILIKTVDRKLVVSARHEERAAGHSSSKSFSREFDIPADVDPNTVTATLGDDGKLTIEAPLASHGRPAHRAPAGSTRPPPRIDVTIRRLPRQ